MRLPQFPNSEAAGVPPDRRLHRSVAFQLGLEPGAVRVGSAGVPRGAAPPRLLRERQRRRRPAQRTDCLVDIRHDTIRDAEKHPFNTRLTALSPGPPR